jgi:hypothetical protein
MRAQVAGYSGTPLAKKLGIRTGSLVLGKNTPADYRDWLAPLPPDVRFVSTVGQSTDIVHLFETHKAALATALRALRKKIRDDAAVWVSWPKKSSKVATDITEDTIRDVALPLGFVDVKVCAVSDVWSGLKLVIRKALRSATGTSNTKSEVSNEPNATTTTTTTPLFKKLNLGSHTVIYVLNAPASFELELAALSGVRVQRSLSARPAHVSFAMAFIVTQAELDSASERMAKVCEGDAVLWLVYPKTTSKKYRCEFNRDSGWSALGAAGFEPVRVVAIDADWSALRFRRVTHIKRMTRDPGRAISGAGKGKSQSTGKSNSHPPSASRP